MKRVISLLLVLAMLMLVAGCTSQTSNEPAEPVEPAAPAEPVKLTIGAASVGGGFHNGASALANAVNSNLDGYELAVEVTGASAANAALLATGEVPFAMVDTTIAYEAYNGIEDFAGNGISTLRCLFPGWPGTFIFVVPASKGFKNIEDLKGTNFSGATVGSGTNIFVHRCLDLFDITFNDLALPNSDASRGVADGTVDGFSLMYPSSAVTELEASVDINILTLDDAQKAKFQEAYPQYLWLSVPAGAYKCVPETVYNPGAFNLFCTSSEVDEETVYQIVKCAYENIDDINAVFPFCGESMTPENLANCSIPFHAGTIRYFKERGWDVPAELIPDEAK